MKIYIDRTHCDICQSFCDRHVAKLVRWPQGTDRPCITATEDDGQRDLTLIVTHGQNQVVTLELDDRLREIVSVEGLSAFLE